MATKLNKFLHRLVTLWEIFPGITLIMSFVAGFLVVENYDTAASVAIFLLVLSVVVQPVVMIIALFQKRWKMALLSLMGLIVSAIIALFAIVGIAVGQHHPPRQADDEWLIDTTDMEIDSIGAETDSTNTDLACTLTADDEE